MILYYKNNEPYSDNAEIFSRQEISENMRFASELDLDELHLWSEGKISSKGDLNLHPLQLCSFLFSDKIRLQVLSISNGEASSGEIFRSIREWDNSGYINQDGSFREPFDSSSGSFDSYSRISQLYDTRQIVVKLSQLGIVNSAKREIIDGLGRNRNVTLYNLNPHYVESTLVAGMIVGALKSIEELTPYSELIAEPKADIQRNFKTLGILAESRNGLTARKIYLTLKGNSVPENPEELEKALNSFQTTCLTSMCEAGFVSRQNNNPVYQLKKDFQESEDIERGIVRDGDGLIDLVLVEVNSRFREERLTLADLRRITDKIRDREGLVSSGSNYAVNKLLNRGIIQISDGFITEVKPNLRKNLPTLAQGGQASDLLKLVQNSIGIRKFTFDEIDQLLNQVEGIRHTDGTIDVLRKNELWWYFQSKVLDSMGKIDSRRINLYTITEKGLDCFGIWREILADPVRFLSIIGNEDFRNPSKLGRISMLTQNSAAERQMRNMPKLFQDIYEYTFSNAAEATLERTIEQRENTEISQTVKVNMLRKLKLESNE